MIGFYEQTHTLATADVDMNGEWRTSAIFLAMQESAGAQCDGFGLDVASLRERNIAWVLTRGHLHMDRVPKLGETVTVRTWPKTPQHFFFPRYFELYANGERVGCASTLFVQLDLTTRRMVKPWIGDNETLSCELEPPLPLPGNLPMLDAPVIERSRTAQYSDLDINQHVNNTRYLDWFCDCFDADFHRAHQLRDVLIHYNHEIRPEAAVTLALQQQNAVSVLKGSVEDALCFAMSAEWGERRNEGDE